MDYQKIRDKIAEGQEIVEKHKDETPKPVLEFCFSMFEINEVLVDKLEEIDNKINKNSSNSSVPPFLILTVSAANARSPKINLVINLGISVQTSLE